MKKNECVILSYCPIKSEYESDFWNEFCENCIDKGCKVIYLGPRRFPNQKVKSYIIPRNLKDVYCELPKEITVGILDDSVIDICYQREQAFLQTKGIEPRIAIHKILTLINDINIYYSIKCIVTWTSVTPVSFLLREFAKKNKIKCYEAERAPLHNYIWIEEKGIFDKSLMWEQYVPFEGDNQKIGKFIVDEVKNNVYGFRKPTVLNKKTILKNKKILFCPMDNIYEAVWLPQNHPLSKERYPNAVSPIEFIRKISEIASNTGYEFIIKPHPSCKYITTKKFPTVNICDDDLNYLLQISDIVLCNHTKVSYPAIALGKNVVTFVKNTILCADLGRFVDFETFNPSTIIFDEKDTIYWERVFDFFGWLANNYFYTIKRNGKHIKTFVEEVIK